MAGVRSSRRYRFAIYESNLLNNAAHPVTGAPTPGIHTRVADITNVASKKSGDYLLNGSGSVKFTVPLSSKAAKEIVGYELLRCLVVFNEDASGNMAVRWTGYIASVDINTDSDTVSVSCIGWFDLLDRRELRYPISFNNLDAGVIATRLLSTANNQITSPNTVNIDKGTAYARTGIDTFATNAEDLLFGVGELDRYDTSLILSSTSVFPVSNPAGTPVALDTGYPRITTTWAKSGSGSLELKSTNKNGPSFVSIRPPAALQGTVNGRLLIDTAGVKTVYVRAKINITSITAGAYFRFALDEIAGFTGNTPIGGTTYSASYTAAGEYDVFIPLSWSGSAAVDLRLMAQVYSTASSSITVCIDNLTVAQATSSSGDVSTVVPTPIEIGSVTSPANPAGANRIRSYSKGQKIGSAIKELSAVEGGFDYEVAATEEAVSVGNLSGTTIRRYLNIYYSQVKAGTTIYGQGTDRANVVFGYRWGPRNVQKLGVQRDATNMANRINAKSPAQNFMAQDAAAIAAYGLLEDTTAVNDANLADRVLLGVAGAELYFRKQPLQTYSIVPFPWDGNKTGRSYRFGIDYNLGDICYLVARSGALSIGSVSPQAIRIFGVSWELDEEGNERITSIKTIAS